MSKQPSFVGIDLFAGAGGLSLGAKKAGINVSLAVEIDKYAAQTYSSNHPETKIIVDDIRNVSKLNMPRNAIKILFGGPPCQGFSDSNRRTRNRNNPDNWLLKEFLRITNELKPEWVVFENVRGFVTTENKLFISSIISDFEDIGYSCSWTILNAYDFGIPQNRSRFFLVASRQGMIVSFPQKKKNCFNVSDAISDLPSLKNGASENILFYRSEARSAYAAELRGDLGSCSGHLVSKNAPRIIERYKYIPPGGNWEDIPPALMENYTDSSRCHTGIYHRLNPDEPSITIGNYRKNMLIHPWEDRGLSVREAARIQSFPDWYNFQGSIGFQQQQVGNAVPPILAQEVFSIITNGDYKHA